MRVSKYFSVNKILSRREADKYIKEGKVKVNGQILTNIGQDVNPSVDKIEIVGKIAPKRTIAFHKPRGISSSKIASEGKNIFDLLPEYKDLNAIGRLDKDSEGLILLSDDGVLTNIITGQDHLIEKEYIVDVREDVTQTKMNAMSQGMMLEDGPTLPAKAEILDEHRYVIILTEGRNHQVRRMANKVRLTVTRLKRVRIGAIKLDDLASGKVRLLKDTEIEKLKRFQNS